MGQIVADVRFMQQALQLATGGRGFVSPNPLVGCVIVKHGQVVGQGYHQRFGGPHAEIYALQAAGPDARGATLYVTLEPCCHHGKTPPCSEAILEAGIGRVVVALRDPNPLVAGGGVARLHEAGIPVRLGICEDEARQLNEAFLKHVTTRCPFVTLKSAITLDGKIATSTGASRWITGAQARAAVHRLRHATDAIMVGIGTVLQDDPLLTTRLPDQPGVNPIRVIVDSTLRLPLQVQVLDVAPDRRTLVATTTRADGERQRQLQERGVEIVCLPAYDDGRVHLEALLQYLGAHGTASVLVEGGATLSAALLRHGLIDKVLFFVAPKIIGGDGVDAIGPCGVATMAQAIRLQAVTWQGLGEDLMLQAYLAGMPCTSDAEGTE
jgi:diaminohydroxyphosphoribosylaminopyrimidine deaminase/5-amino-6-(5-phosphoribosylamino)uracil reductase